jgi:hypothetical protein
MTIQSLSVHAKGSFILVEIATCSKIPEVMVEVQSDLLGSRIMGRRKGLTITVKYTCSLSSNSYESYYISPNYSPMQRPLISESHFWIAQVSLPRWGKRLHGPVFYLLAAWGPSIRRDSKSPASMVFLHTGTGPCGRISRPLLSTITSGEQFGFGPRRM